MFRYPGGKRHLKKKIVHRISSHYSNTPDAIYVEPFFGAGAIGLSLMDSGIIRSITINDFDPGISAFWSSVIHESEKLCERVERFVPSVGKFYKYKSFFLSLQKNTQMPILNVDMGFKKLALHQMSYSGLGAMSGGPLGGKKQNSPYKIDCRWSPSHIVKKIKKYSNMFSHINVVHNRCLNWDFWTVLTDCKRRSDSHFYYLDPPYFNKGSQLYQYSFSGRDHINLMLRLKESKHAWLLSYDDAPEIRNLYDWAHIEEIEANYTINTSRQKTELLISKGT